MSTLLHTRRTPFVAGLFAVAATAVLLLTTALANPVSAHGSVIDPASRNYGCWDRWGANHMDPRMATEDPMCWQAWQANPNTMWSWMGLFREGAAGNHQAVIPDGQLCSAGRTQGGYYASLDAVGAWRTTSIGNNFRIRLYDQASHGADYIRVYVTKQGFDALNKPLAWSDLELVGQIGNTPAAQWEQVTSGVAINVPANAPGRTGRHIVYTIWQASHLDQSYYLCSDVDFGGSTPPPTTPPPTTPPPTTPPPTTPPPATPPPAGNGCSATYSVVSTWTGGFQGEIKVTAGSAAIRGWRVTWSLPAGQQVSQAWNANLTTSGGTVAATNVAHNGSLGAGASTTFGFIGSGSSATPVLACSATA